jgi:aspartate kinase
MKIMKFGGGCLKNDESFLRVAKIIASEKDRPFVVVSAIYSMTDLLLESVLNAQKSEKNISGAIGNIKEKHRAIVEKTITDQAVRKEIYPKMETMIEKVGKLLTGISYTGEITPAVRSHVLSYGERLSALILSGVLRSKSMESVLIESDKIGMVTDENLENATVILSEFRNNFRPAVQSLSNNKIIPVITGFFGCTSEGKISTFGRNGSDYSAAVIAFATHASELEIWKDVDGFMSADPKIVKNAHRIERLSYYEAAELSYFGAKILHPRTLEPLMGLDISVRIKNLFDPERWGTEILPEAHEKDDIIKSVTCNRGIAVIRIHGPGVGYKPGIIAQIGHLLSGVGINIYSILTSQTCINLLVDKKDARSSYEAIKEMKGGVIDEINLEKDVTLIAVVGEGLLKKKGLAARIFTAVSKENVNVKMISTGASEVASYFVVHQDDTEKVVNAVHREFLE